jgi:plasmid stabilization system protein ParE
VASTRALFHPGASEDYEAAYAWYLTHGIAIANDFEREIERCLRLIEEGPLRWPRYDAQRRRMIVRKFPYSIVYEIINEQITVLAVAHARRRPYYWRERISEV